MAGSCFLVQVVHGGEEGMLGRAREAQSHQEAQTLGPRACASRGQHSLIPGPLRSLFQGPFSSAPVGACMFISNSVSVTERGTPSAGG